MNQEELLLKISNEVLSLYEFHGYDISKENIIKIGKLIIEVMPDITEEKVTEFFRNVNVGKYGVLYKPPTYLMTMFQQYIKDNTRKLAI